MEFAISWTMASGKPTYEGRCVDCNCLIGPWFSLKDAKKGMTSHHKRCDACHHKHVFSPPGKSPSLHD